MKKRNKTGLIISTLMLVVVTGFCVMTISGTFQWLKSQGPEFSLISNDTTKAEASESYTISIDQIETLSLKIYNGDITVLPTDAEEITVELNKTAWGSSVEQAEARLEGLALAESISGNTLDLSFEGQTGNYAFSFGTQIPPRIDVVISVPAGMEIQLQNWNGDVSIQAFQGEVAIETGFGDVYIEGLSGKLSVFNSSGSLTVVDVDAGGEEIKLGNNFGEINLENLLAGALTIEASSANLIVNDIQINGECSIHNQYALTEITDFSCGGVTIETYGSYITLENGTIDKALSANYYYADLTMEQVYASSYDLETNDGNLTVDGIQGQVRISSQYGNIEIIHGNQAALDIENINGSVSYSGSLNPQTSQSISTSFGDISVELPADSAFDILLETEYGTIETDFQLTLTGEISAQHIEGMINQGGPLLTLSTQSAKIEFTIIENYDN